MIISSPVKQSSKNLHGICTSMASDQGVRSLVLIDFTAISNQSRNYQNLCLRWCVVDTNLLLDWFYTFLSVLRVFNYFVTILYMFVDYLVFLNDVINVFIRFCINSAPGSTLALNRRLSLVFHHFYHNIIFISKNAIIRVSNQTRCLQRHNYSSIHLEVYLYCSCANQVFRFGNSNILFIDYFYNKRGEYPD